MSGSMTDGGLAFEDLIDELDSITGPDTEAVVIIAVNGPIISVRTRGPADLCNDAVERTAEIDLDTIECPLLH